MFVSAVEMRKFKTILLTLLCLQYCHSLSVSDNEIDVQENEIPRSGTKDVHGKSPASHLPCKQNFHEI